MATKETNELKTETPIVKEEVTTPVVKEKTDRDLTVQELVKKYTIKDTQGLPMFHDTEKIEAALTMTDDEVKKFLGEHDPELYFRRGKINKMRVIGIGSLLDEDRVEVQTLRKILPEFPQILMFKHETQNLYNLLIPKKLSEHELDSNGDFINEHVPFETIPVNFHAGVSTKEFGTFPGSFEPTFFAKYMQRSISRIRARAVKNLTL